MGQLRADLLLSLTDKLSGPIGKTGRALRAAERQFAALNRASAVGVRQNMISDLQKIGATSSQIDRVSRAWERYRVSAKLASDATKWTDAQREQVKMWERANISALKKVNHAHQGRQAPAAVSTPVAEPRRNALAAAATASMRYVAPAAVAYASARALKSYAEADRAIKRIGITAEATDKEIEGVGSTAYNIAQEVALPYEKVVQGLDTLVAQGRNLKDSMAFLPAVSRTAAATNSEVDDIAKTADSIGTNFKIAGREMQSAFDLHASGIGKALLSAFDDERLESFIKRAPFTRFTDKTITGGDELREAIRLTKARGYSFDDEERTVGMRCVAASIVNGYGEAVAGISVSGPTIRLPDARVREIGQWIVESAAEVSRRLGAGQAI